MDQWATFQGGSFHLCKREISQHANKAVEKGNVHYWEVTTADWKFVQLIFKIMCSKFHSWGSQMCVLTNVVLLCLLFSSHCNAYAVMTLGYNLHFSND